jgi:hypothetical protein
MRSRNNSSILDSARSSRASRASLSMNLYYFGAVVAREVPNSTPNRISR